MLIDEQVFTNTVNFTLSELVLYLTTQSNIASSVDKGRDYVEIEAWLVDALSTFFDHQTDSVSFRFGNQVQFLQKT